VNGIHFSGNTLAENQLKKQMKGTKEMSRFTLFPEQVPNPFGDSLAKTQSFKSYLADYGYLSLSKTKRNY